MPGIRTFIAVPLDRQLLQQIAEISQFLKQSVPGGVSWVTPGSIHLTLKFLGEINPNQVNDVKNQLQRIVPNFSSFEMNANGLGCFPNLNRPRVVWIGLNAPKALDRLQAEIETACAEIGFEREQRKFSPHLTLGRIKPYARQEDIMCLQTALQKIPSLNFGTSLVGTVVIYKSDLQPKGAVYSPLFTVSMRQNEVGGN